MQLPLPREFHEKMEHTGSRDTSTKTGPRLPSQIYRETKIRHTVYEPAETGVEDGLIHQRVMTHIEME